MTDEINPIINQILAFSDYKTDIETQLRSFNEFYTSQLERVLVEIKVFKETLADNNKKQMMTSRSLTKPDEKLPEQPSKKLNFNKFPKKSNVSNKKDDIDIEEILGSSIPKPF